jgi:hypothetical protein
MPRTTYYLTIFVVGFSFIAATAVMAQVQPSASGGATQDDERMMIPPMLIGTPYANEAGVDLRQNVLTTQVGATVAYDDNVLPDEFSTPVGDTMISIAPVVSYLRSTPKQQDIFDYSPTYTIYTPEAVLASGNTTTSSPGNTSALNSLNQSADGIFQGQLSKRFTLGLQDGFIRTSNVFDVSYPFSAIGLGGSTQAPTPAAIAPYAEQLRNQATVFLSYQFSPYGMFGGSGSFANIRFPNPSQSTGFYNSDGSVGSIFYDRRFARRQYFGATYGYNWVQAYRTGISAESETNEVLGFYSVFFNRNFSLSAAAGTKYALTRVIPVQTPATSWNPEIVLSMGWQGNRGNVSASFLRTVASGGGLIGTFNSVSANLGAGWKLQRFWNASVSFSYQNIEPVSYLVGLPYQGGNSLMAQGSIQRALGTHFTMQCGYQRLHEQYIGIAAVSADPDGDRAYVTINYLLRKPLGR